MKSLLLLVMILATSCATTSGCGYAKAKAYNDRQAKKAKRHRVSYADDIRNPENEEFVNEVAFNEDIEPAMVTQAMFNMRYGIE
jgi:hypothetical protein